MRRRPPGRRRTVVFDLDGTLVRGDSLGRFLGSSWRREPWRAVLALALCPALLVSRTRGELLVVATATVGLGPRGVDRRWRRHAVRHARRRIGPALERLAAHVAAGDRVVVATACAEPLARLVLADLDLTGVELVASPYAHRRWLPPRATAIRGELKVEALRAHGVDLPVDDAYSDSLLDLPLLRAARTAHLVAGRDLTRLRRVLGDVEVLETR
ncbi:HAD family hydrolase [Kineococcus rhizosphaerae]|uniref:Phosphatidylglycerophosphatase C n=1 Tax=Kineococcus rhizosphaerae TaxID=559628 RepID=A0A2T0QZF0_9ACTN|nr:HAD family hydrolase [Kineococcus rhizosphaerae]PRY12064.1 phosphatidylglycerophosphatase C [Kineococcus rhizosphaerae]